MSLQSGYIDPSAALVKRCKEGEKKAFSELYSLYAKAMLNTSMRILNNREEAEDVLQESFLKAFQSIPNFDQKVSFGSWMKRIVVNRSIDVIRKRKNQFIPLDEAEIVEMEAIEEEPVYDVDAIRSCIGELPDGYRIVLTLFLVEDYSHKEIAELMQFSEGTSRSQYNRAKNKLIELVKLKTVVHER